MYVGTVKRKKNVSIGHFIIQAARPRAIITPPPPQQIEPVSLIYLYKSSFLVDTLSRMGFCSS